MNPSSEQFLSGRNEQFPFCEVICGARRCEPLTAGEAALRVSTGPSEAPSSRTSAPSQVSLFPDKESPHCKPQCQVHPANSHLGADLTVSRPQTYRQALSLPSFKLKTPPDHLSDQHTPPADRHCTFSTFTGQGAKPRGAISVC